MQLALDIETTIHNRTLCLIQLASAQATYLLDALELSDLSPLGDLLGDPEVIKVIHNATFERSVLQRYGVPLTGVVDTLRVSRKLRGSKIDGGHSLKAVCARELAIELDKSEQVSDWSQRPLSERQVAYAAMDAEVLLRLYQHFGRPAPAEEASNLSLWGE
ncbi:MAG: ribonuclease D [Nannocystis sp.]|nr:ribonuclease D [Nannocystis sp.]